MPSISLYSKSENNIVISVTGSSGYYLQGFYRLSSASSGTFVPADDWYTGTSGTKLITFSGLSSGTTYVVNCRYNTSKSSSGASWCTSLTVTTDSPVVYRTMNLKCGTGISYYDVYTGSTFVKRITSTSYESFDVASGTSLTFKNVTFKDGYSSIKWWYNSSSSYDYPNKSTTNPDYKLTSTYDRWGYFEATSYTPPTVTYYYQIQYKYGASIVGSTNGSGQSTSGYITVNASDTTAPSGYTKTGTYSAGGTGCSWNGTYSYWRITATDSGSRAYCIVNVTPSSTTYYYRVRFISGGTVVSYTDYSDSSTASSIAVYPSDYSPPSGYVKTGTYAGSNGAVWYANEQYWRVSSTSSSSPGYCDIYITAKTYYYQIQYKYGTSIISTTSGSKQSTTGYAIVNASDTTAPSGYEKTGSYSAGGTGCTWQSSNSRWLITSTDSSNRAYCIVNIQPEEVTYYYTIKYWYGSTLVSSTNGSASSRTGYITVAASDTTAPTGYVKNGTYSAGGTSCTWVSEGEYWRVSATSSSSRSDCNVGLSIATYSLFTYDVYGGSSHYRTEYTVHYGYTFDPSIYSSPPTGYIYDHTESPSGTVVTSITITGNRSMFLHYNAIQPTKPVATFTINSTTPNSINITANVTNTLTYSTKWYLAYSTDSSFATYNTVEGSGSSITTTISDLTTHTTYYFKVVNKYNDMYSWSDNSTSATTRYPYFVWDFNDNLSNRRPTAAEWLRLANKIEQFRSTTITRKSEIAVNNTLSHNLFNEMASAVNYNTTVGQGDTIYISTLNGLKNKTNEYA